MANRKFYLQIDTNQYTGNFNRELCAYVFGAFYDAQEWVEDLRQLFCKELGENHRLSEILSYFNDEHGSTVCEIHQQNSLKVYFDEDPSEFAELIEDRLKKFPEALKNSWEFATTDLKILRISMYSSETKETEQPWSDNPLFT